MVLKDHDDEPNRSYRLDPRATSPAGTDRTGSDTASTEELVPSTRLLVLAAAGVAFVSLSAPATAAAPEEHCVVDVVGQEADGLLVLSEERCYRSFDQAQADAAVPPGGEMSLLATSGGTLGVHYDGSNFTGSSITVSGTSCSGGYTNLTSSWRNRISSTLNGCPVVRFFDGLYLSGSSETMLASGNLYYMNNKSESIQYTS